ncbi:MAG: hypothetical protein Q8M98_10410 [Candidatus Cloacimonadaceae bacterium]|nr:hypothetical protein [Candidatus Cloacimonadaceae bacterium]
MIKFEETVIKFEELVIKTRQQQPIIIPTFPPFEVLVIKFEVLLEGLYSPVHPDKLTLPRFLS